MKSSDNINELATALSAFQGEVKNPRASKKVEVTPYKGKPYSYMYTPLNEVADEIKPLLAKHGLSYVQTPGSEVIEYTKLMGQQDARELVTTTGAATFLITRIMHKSGQWIESDRLTVTTGGGAQEAGSAISYARRYQLTAMLGIAADGDDDGSGFDGKPAQITDRPTTAPTPKTTAPPPPKASGLEVVDLSKVPDKELGEALNCVPFKNGKNAGKTMGELPEKDLEWLINAEKAGDKTKDNARMVLAWKRAAAEQGGDEELKEEPPW